MAEQKEIQNEDEEINVVGTDPEEAEAAGQGPWPRRQSAGKGSSTRHEPPAAMRMCICVFGTHR